MNRIVVFVLSASLALWSAGSVSGQEVRAPAIAQQAQTAQPEDRSSEPGSVAILRGLDKVTARTRDFEAPIGEEVAFGALGVTVRYCRKRPPEEPPEVFAFVQVNDRRTDGFGVETEGERIFSGWMFASNPALNALEHPVYDVWVIDCRT
jgi:hypothetical protein